MEAHQRHAMSTAPRIAGDPQSLFPLGRGSSSQPRRIELPAASEDSFQIKVLSWALSGARSLLEGLFSPMSLKQCDSPSHSDIERGRERRTGCGAVGLIGREPGLRPGGVIPSIHEGSLHRDVPSEVW